MRSGSNKLNHQRPGLGRVFVILITELETEVLHRNFRGARSLPPVRSEERRERGQSTRDRRWLRKEATKAGEVGEEEWLELCWKNAGDEEEVAERARGKQLRGHYPVFPRWPSHRLRQLASARRRRRREQRATTRLCRDEGLLHRFQGERGGSKTSVFQLKKKKGRGADVANKDGSRLPSPD